MERAQKEAAEKNQEQLKQKENEQRQKMEAQERSFNENLGQLEEKIKKERENFRVMLERTLKHYLQVSLAWIQADPHSSRREGQNFKQNHDPRGQHKWHIIF